MGQPILPRHEWDFDKVPDSELVACCYWEYARESAFIRDALREAGDCVRRDLQGREDVDPKGKRPHWCEKLDKLQSIGYRDWQLQQEALAMIQTISAETDALKAASPEPLADKLALWLVARYALAAKSLRDQADWRRLREFCQDLVELRKGDHSAQRLRLERERWESEQHEAAKKEADLKKISPALDLMNRKALLSLLGIASIDSPVGLAPLSAEELVPLMVEHFRKAGTHESNQIKPDQTSDARP